MKEPNGSTNKPEQRAPVAGMNAADISQPSGLFAGQARSMNALMWTVVIGLFPGIVTNVYFFGIGVLLQISCAIAVVVVTDEAVAKFHNQTQGTSAWDGTAVVLALIVAISIPPYSPWWICAIASIVANIFGKHIYGGTGQNLFNPAMVGVAFALVCFPTLSSYWPNANAIGQMSSVDIFRTFFSLKANFPDAVSGATLLEFERTQISNAMMRGEFSHSQQYGVLAERGWQWVNLAYLGGGLMLCIRRVIPWTIPITLLGTLFVIAMVFNSLDEQRYAGPVFQCFSGAVIVAAFFVATDPVSSPVGQRALIMYAALIACLVFIFRHLGSYPDGVAFAVLLANAVVPLLDKLCSRQIYGH